MRIFFFFQAEDGIRDVAVTGVQTCALPISYSPYDNVPAGPRPNLLVTGSLHDPRVLIHEPAKWVARLRATGSPGGRLLFRPELGAGAPVGPAGRYDHPRYQAEILAFILDEAGVPGVLQCCGMSEGQPL